MEKEIWKDIKNYEGLYQVSNLGNVKSLNYSHTGKEQILKPPTTKAGYLRVYLYKEGKKRKRFLVHRLVAMAFLDNSDNLPQVNHKDENKKNNCVENLEWCTHTFNMNYGTRLERVAAALKGRIFSTETRKKMSAKATNGKNSKPVLQIDPVTNEVIAEFPSVNEVHRQLGFSCGNISSCCNGRYKTCGGFKWQYKT